MTITRFGKETVVKFIGGDMIVRRAGTTEVEFRRRLVETKRRALDLRVPFGQFQRVWLAQTERVFDAQGLPQPWPQLSAAYRAWKQRRYPGKTIMRRTDRLYDSLTSPGNSDMIWEVTPRTIRYGTRVPYWLPHQTGEGRMPHRPTLILLPATFRELNKLVIEFLNEGFHGRSMPAFG